MLAHLPNVHPLVVTFPVALLVAGLLRELLAAATK
jgi:uncharacterized membrane protein